MDSEGIASAGLTEKCNTKRRTGYAQQDGGYFPETHFPILPVAVKYGFCCGDYTSRCSIGQPPVLKCLV
jgi:hypothetical protein